MKDSRPTGLSQETWEEAASGGIEVWEEDDGRVRMHAGGGLFPTLDPNDVEGQVRAAINEQRAAYERWSSSS